MIVDLHTHVWESPEQLGRGAAQRLLRHGGQPWDRPDASPSAHDSAMEPVQFAVILGFESQMLGGSISAEQVARYVERRPSKYLGFAGIDPLFGEAAKRVAQAQEMGLVGVTICPAAQGFHPSHTKAWPLYEACAERGLPLLVHGVSHLSSEGKLEFAQPVLLDEVAREFPKLRIIISQVGHPWIEETLTLMSKHRNVFADLSSVVTRPWQLYNLLHSAHQQCVMDRLLFGSDFPQCTPQKAITTIYSVNTLTQGTMLPSVPREQLRSIVERDVLEVLGIRRKEKEKTQVKAQAIAQEISVPVSSPVSAPVSTPVSTPVAAMPIALAAAAPSVTTAAPVTPIAPVSSDAAVDDEVKDDISDTYELEESSDVDADVADTAAASSKDVEEDDAADDVDGERNDDSSLEDAPSETKPGD